MSDRGRLTPEAIERLTANTEPWLSCDECFDRLDAVIEDVVLSNLPMPEAFRVHLMACPACDEEARSLAGLIADGAG
ncbi:MAG: hypothetical protein K0S05_301 [Agromyces sp.]|jgi:hypothetical protein|nr:hypothetical protein [Agromyces sp.]